MTSNHSLLMNLEERGKLAPQWIHIRVNEKNQHISNHSETHNLSEVGSL